MTLLLILLLVLLVVLGVPAVRQKLLSGPAFAFFKRVLPPLSKTERDAMEAGDVWWDGELFSGNPDWFRLLRTKAPQLTAREQEFVHNQLEILLAMLDDFKIVATDRDLPQEVWQYLRDERFFAMIIGREYGGLGFSPAANSYIVSRIATRSVSCAVTVMVPNSLGPGELLSHYGTQEQQEYWLPALADGREIPCFALTGPEAGSDAGGIPDTGMVCRGEHDGQEVLGIRLNWDKRYITLAPVATVLGLAFKLYDPDQLLGEQENIGITCALIPTSHPGVTVGDRHYPLMQAFMNGTTTGENVFIPLDWIIGGRDYAGRGWRMLVESLSAGRGISLPALATATGHVAQRYTGAYTYVRQQFGLPIGKFEGVQEAMGLIGGRNYTLESMRRLTNTALCEGYSPAVITAMTKYHMTEMGRDVMDAAMDVHAGKGIQMGPLNYLANNYLATPISITVEGANILTRSLMIFGQGATRCHPYVLAEMAAAANEDRHQGLQEFDRLLRKHVQYAAGNTLFSCWHGLTSAYFADRPVSGEVGRYYQHLTRFSRALAVSTDFAMLTLGGDLKRREMLSARLGDVLSHLYMASAVLKRYEDDGRQQGDLPFLRYAMQWHLSEVSRALQGFCRNFPNRWLGRFLRLVVLPWGNHFHAPSDNQAKAVAEAMLEPGVTRDRHTFLSYWRDEPEDVTGHMELAFQHMLQLKDVYRRLRQAEKDGQLAPDLSGARLVAAATAANLVSEAEAKELQYTEELRRRAIAVDSFPADNFTTGQFSARPVAKEPGR